MALSSCGGKMAGCPVRGLQQASAFKRAWLRKILRPYPARPTRWLLN